MSETNKLDCGCSDAKVVTVHDGAKTPQDYIDEALVVLHDQQTLMANTYQQDLIIDHVVNILEASKT